MKMRLPKIQKYCARPMILDGIRFASRREAARYEELKIMRRSGEIVELGTHPEFPITIKGEIICNVILDFKYLPKGEREPVYEDVKGYDNPLSKLKRKLVEALYGIQVRIVK